MRKTAAIPHAPTPAFERMWKSMLRTLEPAEKRGVAIVVYDAEAIRRQSEFSAAIRQLESAEFNRRLKAVVERTSRSLQHQNF